MRTIAQVFWGDIEKLPKENILLFVLNTKQPLRYRWLPKYLGKNFIKKFYCKSQEVSIQRKPTPKKSKSNDEPCLIHLSQPAMDYYLGNYDLREFLLCTYARAMHHAIYICGWIIMYFSMKAKWDLIMSPIEKLLD